MALNSALIPKFLCSYRGLTREGLDALRAGMEKMGVITVADRDSAKSKAEVTKWWTKTANDHNGILFYVTNATFDTHVNGALDEMIEVLTKPEVMKKSWVVTEGLSDDNNASVLNKLVEMLEAGRYHPIGRTGSHKPHTAESSEFDEEPFRHGLWALFKELANQMQLDSTFLEIAVEAAVAHRKKRLRYLGLTQPDLDERVRRRLGQLGKKASPRETVTAELIQAQSVALHEHDIISLFRKHIEHIGGLLENLASGRVGLNFDQELLNAGYQMKSLLVESHHPITPEIYQCSAEYPLPELLRLKVRLDSDGLMETCKHLEDDLTEALKAINARTWNEATAAPTRELSLLLAQMRRHLHRLKVAIENWHSDHRSLIECLEILLRQPLDQAETYTIQWLQDEFRSLPTYRSQSKTAPVFWDKPTIFS